MRNGLPLAYSLYRALWSILHLALVGLAVGAVVLWAVQDGNGLAVFTTVADGLSQAQRTVAEAIPFPWGG